MAGYDHELDLKISVHTELRMSRARNKGLKYYKQFLRNQASNYIKKLAVRSFIFNRDNNKCVMCESVELLQIDHIESVYRGGTNKICNLQSLCRSCNAGKKV